MKQRGRPKLKVVVPLKVATQVREQFQQEKDVRRKERLQAVLLAMGGQHTHEEVARVIGRARSAVQTWIARFTEGGITALLARGTSPGRPSGLRASTRKVIESGLREGRWVSAPQARATLSKKRRDPIPLRTVQRWLKQCGGTVKVPRPVHIKKDEAAAQAFAAHLYEKLSGLALPPDRPVRVWVADECRCGLRSFLRRCWGLRGVRVVKPSQQKYQWGYVYGALEVVEGRAEFRFMPSVNLDFSHDFLGQIVATDPGAEHVVIWDQAGFHQRPQDAQLPAGLHLLPLPPYSPELNPVERLWDVIKDTVANRTFAAMGHLENALTEALRPFWSDPKRVLRLVGDGWIHTQANASY
jgi:transposase